MAMSSTTFHDFMFSHTKQAFLVNTVDSQALTPIFMRSNLFQSYLNRKMDDIYLKGTEWYSLNAEILQSALI
ncbi:hypothetical protein T4B_10188 [Trichinella pseudospiralis]|uniref:Uncharacterized protein n=1 Tax=Trichinella pseudospiralis TaxID=6337 RepID=A0A0V1JQR6_TRIPS|nr:hypothetical protein T4B_10188 [Trichinella pseudospiralis]KRZ36901.1 hypothetical protein T4C_3571 [Trichinella pseudospiralis]